MLVPVTTPLQLSVAVGAVKEVTELQLDEIVERFAKSGTGAVMSLTTTFCSCVEVFPFPSE